MDSRDGLPIFIAEPPTFEFKDGVFFSRVKVSGQEFICVYTPNTFIKAHHAATRAATNFFDLPPTVVDWRPD